MPEHIKGGALMKKLLIVFCLVTMTLLFACNGVPALAETDDADNNTATPAAIEQTVEKDVTSDAPVINKKAKKSTKNKKSTKTFNVMKYVKKGKFDWKAYSKAIGAKRVDLFSSNVNLFLPGNCCITITSDNVRTKKLDGENYLFIIYNQDVDYDESEATFFFESEDWGKKIETKDGGSVASVALEKAFLVTKYLKKHPDITKKPKVKGIDWIDGSRIGEYREH